MRKSAYKAGKVIIKEGDRGTEAYIIVDGQVEITRRAPDGSEIVLAKLGDNQMFGEISMIDDSLPRSATVRAVTDVVIAIIPQKSFQEKLQNTPVAVKSILKVLAKRLAETNDMFVDLHGKIQYMVRQQVGQVIDANKTLSEELKAKEEQIEALEAEIEQLKVAGPAKPAKQKNESQGQKLEKDRSMKLSLKDLDKMMQKKKEEE
jgi:CRP-like cAMP-binding protein